MVLFGSSSQDTSFVISCFQVEQEHKGSRGLPDHPQSFIIVCQSTFIEYCQSVPNVFSEGAIFCGFYFSLISY